MMIRIHNSLTRAKEPLVTVEPGHVRMYVCGMTVYDYCHAGHARVMVAFDMVTRYLRARGYRVTYVRNITDIDDKIIKRAAENGEDIGALTARFIQAMDEDAAALGVLKPDAEPRATAHMADMQTLIGELLARGLAYRAGNGDVYYRVRKFAAYGALSGRALDDLRAGARVEAGEQKNDPLDFVLWKAAKPGEPQWASSFGPGRPGWHIECSAMSMKCLGHHFDIHGGGMDLQFPHHENEIAQSEGATGEKFVNTWMHVGFVRVNEEKMSKSLGNFFTVREVLKQYDAEVLRYFILASHYRSPLDYSTENLDAARQALDGLYIALRGVPSSGGADETEYDVRFHAAMEDDFNTPAAFAVLFDLARALNRAREAEPAKAAELASALHRLGGILGLLQRDPDQYLRGAPGGGLDDAEIAALIQRRLDARKARNFSEADRIRAELLEKGVLLEDNPAGTSWRRA